MESVPPIGNQEKAVNFIEKGGTIRNNDPQLQEGFIIIGPPGTGKTYVICYGTLFFIRMMDRIRKSNERYAQVAIATFTNSAADRIIEQFDDIFNKSGLKDKTFYVKRVIAKEVKVRKTVEPYKVTSFKPAYEKIYEWELKRDEVAAARIFIGTIYQIENIMKGSRNNKLKQIKPALLLIDEASQINLSKFNISFYGADERLETIGLVGDPYQLSPIAQIQELSDDVIKTLQGKRGAGQRITRETTLDVNFRMSPIIRELSELFAEYEIKIRDYKDTLLVDLGTFEFNGKLSKNALNLLGKEKKIVLLDDSMHPRSEEQQIGTSRINLLEKDAVELIAKTFKKCYPALKPNEIIVIVPYSAQTVSMETDRWRVGTVDTFQGQEGALVIASTIRTDSDSPLDFVANKNRLNVMFSRGKAKLIILNHRETFKEEVLFQELYDFIERNPSETAILDYNETLENELNEIVGG